MVSAIFVILVINTFLIALCALSLTIALLLRMPESDQRYELLDMIATSIWVGLKVSTVIIAATSFIWIFYLFGALMLSLFA
jgi:hypothetical protein